MTGRAVTAGLRLAAPAKVNLSLRITGRRADGYHLVDTLIAFAGIGDVLACAPSDAVTLDIDGPFAGALGADPDNLVLRAARALSADRTVTRGAALRLTKNLPVAAGIGGGSADAAGTLRLLDRYWDLETDRRQLSEIALALGADVPACLDGRALRARGIGEVIDAAAPLPPVAVVLVNNGRAVDTAAVFGARAGAFSTTTPESAPFEDAASLARWCRTQGNDLSEPALRIEPSIGDVLVALAGVDGCLLAQLSGSGATCFGLFENPEKAGVAARRLSESHPGWWVRATGFRAAPPSIEEAGS